MKKKSTNPNYYVVLLFLILLVLVYYYIVPYFHIPIRYKNFGIKIPSGYKVHGIDVSKYQRNIDWNEVALMKEKDISIQFAFIKATEGCSLVDKHFKSNWKKAQQTNIIVGAYHFFRCNTDATQQANLFAKTVHLQKGNLPPVLDIEDANGICKEQVQKRCKIWLQLIENKYGVKPIVYTNIDFYNQYLDGIVDGYPIWIAHYYQVFKPRIHKKWLFWQHNDSGHINGIKGNVDFNIFNGNMNELKSICL